jgi:ribosomal protein L14
VAECINVFKVKTKLNSTGFATVGDEIGVVINKARPIALASSSAASNIQKVRKGDMRRAVVVRTKKTELRADGRYVKLVPSQFSIGMRLMIDLTIRLVSCLTPKAI